MSISTSLPARTGIVYPEDNGEPMAENTVQFRWIVTIKEGLEKVFRQRPDVFVAGDLLWYPVEGHPEISQCTRRHGRVREAQGGSRLLPSMARGWDRPPGCVRSSVARQPTFRDDQETSIL